MYDLNLLRTFVQVVNNGSMAEAASVLGCTPAAVSQQISRLENAVGSQVLDRLPQGLRVTPVGEVVLEQSRSVLWSIGEMERTIEAAKDPGRGRLRVSSFISMAALVLPSTIKTLRSRFPEARITAIDTDSPAQLHKLSASDVDAAVIYQYDNATEELSTEFEIVEIGIDPVCVALPPGHRLANQETIRLQELANEEWVFFPSHFPNRTMLERAAAENDFRAQRHFDRLRLSRATWICRRRCGNLDHDSVVPCSSQSGHNKAQACWPRAQPDDSSCISLWHSPNPLISALHDELIKEFDASLSANS